MIATRLAREVAQIAAHIKSITAQNVGIQQLFMQMNGQGDQYMPQNTYQIGMLISRVELTREPKLEAQAQLE